MYRPKVKYEPIDLIFLNENFGKMGLFALVDAFNEIRPANAKVSLPSLRHQLRRMGLYKKILIHWSAADTKFLQANYGRYGDVELAEMLNHRRGTYKIIDGK
ncbi:MAG: hypothetical protein LBB41_07550, partial [Prevotellaceae bacterium]|nr:hypothetical protein [Prevotellaceae bacterium]